MKKTVTSANPYMPLWEHVPDGEPRVFEYQGKKRVYVYGSHDTEITEYCGRDYVAWSAPVEDLTDWTCHGTCFQAADNSILYAPDVVQKGDTFYMYAAQQKGSVVTVAKSKTPWGPFTDPVKTDLGFDPGVLVDDDGRVYAFWGFCGSYCAELNEDMATIKEGTFVPHILGHSMVPWNPVDDGHIDPVVAFYEASSPRKIMGKYVYVYSKRTQKPVPELGVFDDNNGFLSYVVSDQPLSGYEMGGDISFNGGEILKNPDGTGTQTYRWGNNHGSLVEIEGKWYIFYHRQTGTDEYARQGMLEPVDVAMDKNGKLFIGDITYENGEPVASKPVEMTSQGAHIDGLPCDEWISAGYACHLHGAKETAYIKPVYDKVPGISAPVVNITDGLVAGYRYLAFGASSPKTVTIVLGEHDTVSGKVHLDAHDGKVIAEFALDEKTDTVTVPVLGGVIGKHAVYFEFTTCGKKRVEFIQFTFDK